MWSMASLSSGVRLPRSCAQDIQAVDGVLGLWELGHGCAGHGVGDQPNPTIACIYIVVAMNAKSGGAARVPPWLGLLAGFSSDACFWQGFPFPLAPGFSSLRQR